MTTSIERTAEPALDTTHSMRRSTVAVLSVALAIRLLVLWDVIVHYPPTWLFTRGMEMGWLAKSILDGHGLASPFGVPTGPSAFVAPGYPVLIAGVFRIFGSYTLTSAIVIICTQIALNLVTVWLMMWIAQKLFDRRVAIVAGLVWACSLPLIWMPTIFWDTSLAICLMVALLALVLHLRCTTTPLSWLFLGAYCAVTGLINPAMIPALAAVLGWLAWNRRKVQPYGIILAALTFCIVFSPWPIRNAKVFHAFIPLRTTVGFELWMGNRPGATGYLDESLFPSFNPAELSDYKLRGELGYTAHKSELAKQYIVSNFFSFVQLSGLRVMRYWLGTGSEKGSPIFALHAALTFGFGAAGLWMLFRERRFDVAILFALPLLIFPLPYYITHAEFRYRLALDPLLTILAAYAVVRLYQRMQAPASASATSQKREAVIG
jgi:4-amino-4-deoxy-L-arabinose transferase-like glycosyltransferase